MLFIRYYNLWLGNFVVKKKTNKKVLVDILTLISCGERSLKSGTVSVGAQTAGPPLRPPFRPARPPGSEGRFSDLQKSRILR